MSFSIGGLASGIDTAALVQSLMQAERIPQQKLQRQQQDALKAVTSWNDLRTRMQTIQTAAENLATPAKALGSVASTSDDKTVKATATAEAAPGQYSIKVNAIATAQQQTKTGLGPLSMTVGAGRSYLTAGTLTLNLDAAAAGVQKVEVTRASAPAAVYGTVPALPLPAGQTTLTVAVDGGTAVDVDLTKQFTDSEGVVRDVKTAQDLAMSIDQQLAGKGATARLAGGRLEIATSVDGSARTLQVGGSAASALGLSTAVTKGQSALVSVNGKSQEVEPQATPGQVDLGSGIKLEVGQKLGLGATTANVVVTTDTTTLGELQGMLNATGSPASAALIAQPDGTNTMVLSSTATGTAGALTIGAPPGTPVLGGFTATTPTDAVVEINGVAVTRSSNKLTDILPGLSLDLLSKPTDGLARTVTVSRDSTGTVDRAKALVEAMNGFVNKVTVDTRYDVKSKTGGPLVGEGTARSLSASLFQKASGVVGTPTLRALSQLGIETTRDGKFELKSEVLTKKLASDPDAVGKVLAEFGSSVAAFAKESAQTGGILTGRRDGAQSEADARQKQADAMQTRLDKIEKRYKATYAAMETALASLKSQGGAMNAALSSFSSSNR